MALPNPHPHHWSPENIMMVWIEETGSDWGIHAPVLEEGSVSCEWNGPLILILLSSDCFLCLLPELALCDKGSFWAQCDISVRINFHWAVLRECPVPLQCKLYGELVCGVGQVSKQTRRQSVGNAFRAFVWRTDCNSVCKIVQWALELWVWVCSAVSIQMFHADNYKMNVNMTVTWDKEERGSLAAL